MEKIEKRKQKFGDSKEEESPAKKESALDKKIDMSLSDLAEANKKARRGRGRGGGASRGGRGAKAGQGRGKTPRAEKVTPDNLVITKAKGRGGKRANAGEDSERQNKKRKNE